MESHGSAEIPSRDPLAVTESQQNPQMTAETEACAGSHLRPVLHMMKAARTAGDNWLKEVMPV